MSSLVDSSQQISNHVAPMDVVFAVLADSANVSQEGKLNILGSFAEINASEFPARHPEMQLVLRLEASPAEVGSEKRLDVAILDQDGAKIGGFELQYTVPQPKVTGEAVHIQSIMRIIDTVFPNAGRYAVHVLINGETKATVPITVKGV